MLILACLYPCVVDAHISSSHISPSRSHSHSRSFGVRNRNHHDTDTQQTKTQLFSELEPIEYNYNETIYSSILISQNVNETFQQLLTVLNQHQQQIINNQKQNQIQAQQLNYAIQTIKQTQLHTDELRTALDASWTLLSAYLVFLMQLGFALLEAGSVRAMNTKNILMQNLLDTCVSIAMFWWIGYGISKGGTNEGWVKKNETFI
jgi:hypothetical protein